MVETHELMASVIDAKPVNFDKDFDELMRARVAELVADKKLAVAQNFFGDAEPVEPEEIETTPEGEKPEEVEKEPEVNDEETT
jgi:hypothetical protein